MNRPNDSNIAERLAVSFPIAFTVAAVLGWIVTSWLDNQKQLRQAK